MDPCHHCDREPCECQKPEPMRVWVVVGDGWVLGAHLTLDGAKARAASLWGDDVTWTPHLDGSVDGVWRDWTYRRLVRVEVKE
jgi:hypothetical protein